MYLPKTSAFPSSPVKQSLRRTDFLNLNPHIVAMVQDHLRVPHGPDPGRRPRHDERSPLQRGPLRQERDGLRDAEDHLLCVSVLDDGPVVDGFDAEVAGVGDLLLRDDDGANGRGGVEPWCRQYGRCSVCQKPA